MQVAGQAAPRCSLIVFREPTSGDVPAYAILSHTWGKEEVIFWDIQAGWRKIQSCATQAAADGLGYFWVDTCCIDKKNAVELGAAINSMFRWYQNAARCYVYLSDISKPDTKADDQRAWEEAFRKSRWFTRGWTFQELIAPRLVDFFSSQGERLGSKLSLESKIHEITGIANKALRGDALSNFSIKKRRSWAERRNTTIEGDEVYCLTGIFDVSMAFKRLEEEIHRLYKGVDFEQFAVGLNLVSFPEATQFVAREKELSKMHELLQGHSSRSCAIPHGLGGMGKSQLAIAYARRHKEKTLSSWAFGTSLSVLSSVDQDKQSLLLPSFCYTLLQTAAEDDGRSKKGGNIRVLCNLPLVC
ncbi:heterokaryon incompatibility protein-domain-containing protein [Bisporella sp. PMI_857]|nr:heterokaryon incompatibility protein-domain-containing protein [Bisporella sp. PMI_857]